MLVNNDLQLTFINTGLSCVKIIGKASGMIVNNPDSALCLVMAPSRYSNHRIITNLNGGFHL